MMLKNVISILVVWFARLQPSLSSYDNPYEVTEFMPETEEPNDWKAPANYGPYVGNTLAGQHEFPYLMDVRVPYLDHLDAVGNLLTTYHVLTTCRTIVNFEKYLPTNEGTQITYYEGPGSIRITFASVYLHEEDRSVLLILAIDENIRMAGLRLASWVQMHPNCQKGKEFAFDYAILGLNRPVQLFPPFVTLAPIFHDPYTARIPDITNLAGISTRTICYVAAWGRNYTNVANPVTLEHKVKIRVYAYADLYSCLQIWDDLCPSNSLPDGDICKDNKPKVLSAGLMCLNVRSVGAVCDTNRGAPIVCYDQIYGIVTRGVPREKCDSTKPQPFMAVNMHRLEIGQPPLYSGAMVGANRRGKAPQNTYDTVLLYTRGGGPMSVPVKFPTLSIYLLVEATVSSFFY